MVWRQPILPSISISPSLGFSALYVHFSCESPSQFVVVSFGLWMSIWYDYYFDFSSVLRFPDVYSHQLHLWVRLSWWGVCVTASLPPLRLNLSTPLTTPRLQVMACFTCDEEEKRHLRLHSEARKYFPRHLLRVHSSSRPCQALKPSPSALTPQDYKLLEQHEFATQFALWVHFYFSA